MMDTRELPRHGTLSAAAASAPSFLTWIVLFLLIVAALAGVEWNMLRNVNLEASDFAANSLLIQDAKRLHLNPMVAVNDAQASLPGAQHATQQDARKSLEKARQHSALIDCRFRLRFAEPAGSGSHFLGHRWRC